MHIPDYISESLETNFWIKIFKKCFIIWAKLFERNLSRGAGVLHVEGLTAREVVGTHGFRRLLVHTTIGLYTFLIWNPTGFLWSRSESKDRTWTWKEPLTTKLTNATRPLILLIFKTQKSYLMYQLPLTTIHWIQITLLWHSTERKKCIHTVPY